MKTIIQSIILVSILLSPILPNQSYSQNRRQKQTTLKKQAKPEWIYFGEEVGSNAAYYLNAKRIGRTQQRPILAWEKKVFLAKEDNGEYLVMLYEHDCAENKSRNLESTRNNKKGDVLHHASREELEELGMVEWIYVAPGTTRETILSAACEAASSSN